MGKVFCYWYPKRGGRDGNAQIDAGNDGRQTMWRRFFTPPLTIRAHQRAMD